MEHTKLPIRADLRKAIGKDVGDTVTIKPAGTYNILIRCSIKLPHNKARPAITDRAPYVF